MVFWCLVKPTEKQMQGDGGWVIHEHLEEYNRNAVSVLLSSIEQFIIVFGLSVKLESQTIVFDQ